MRVQTFGVDVSHWEGMIDWSQAANYVPFAYYKCTDGANYVDDLFAANKDGCQQAGMPHAAYHYFQPGVDPDQQAVFFANTAGDGYKVLIGDFEKPPHDLRIYQDSIRSFLAKLEQLTHIKPAIYTSSGHWNEFCARPYPDWCDDYQLLVAHYTVGRRPTIPIGWSNYFIWQYSENVWFPGCLEIADGNWFNGDLVSMRAWFGNYHPTDPPIYTKSRARVLINMKVRDAPNVTAKEVLLLPRGSVVEIDDVGGYDAWIKHAKGWTAVERKGFRYMEILK